MLRRNLCISLIPLLLLTAAAIGQNSPGVGQSADATLRIHIFDANRAAIPTAKVWVLGKGDKPGKQAKTTDGQGEIVFRNLRPEHPDYTIIVMAQGFETYKGEEVTLNPGINRLEIQLDVKRITETVEIRQAEQEKATDPTITAAAATLTESQLAQLPDDPVQFEAALRQMAGPGAVIQIDGFPGTSLPPKSQIREVRFRLNPFSADNHDASQLGVDILTKPGSDLWYGSLNGGFRNSAVAARNAFAPVRGSDQNRRLGATLQGPLQRNRTSIFLSAEGSEGFESKTIVAVLPDGDFEDIIRRSARKLDLSARVERKLTDSHTLRLQYQRNGNRQGNLGVGDFDLPERAYSMNAVEQLLRVSDTGLLTSNLVNDLRFQAGWLNTDIDPGSSAPAVIVLNTFNAGGAQLQSNRDIGTLRLFDDVSFVKSRHSFKSGIALERIGNATRERRNFNGTFIFPRIEEFLAQQPTTFVERSGDPDLRFHQYQVGWYFQDGIRVRKDLSLNLGVRHELQSNLRDYDNVAPRLSIIWSPFKSGRLTLRAGAGLFNTWFESDLFEQTLRVNGERQQDEVIVNPSFPVPRTGRNPVVLPPGIIRHDPSARMPYIEAASFGADLKIGGIALLRSLYLAQHGVHLLRSRDINAPGANGIRPDPRFGNIVSIESTANSHLHLATFTLTPVQFSRRLFWVVNYTLSKSTNDVDNALDLPADNFNLTAERGPSSIDTRHRLFGIMNVHPLRSLALGTVFHFNSARPYNITTGLDNNADTIFNDRPAGIGRNTARGEPEWDVSARLSWTLGFGKAHSTTTESSPGAVRGSGTLETVAALSPDVSDSRWRVMLFVQGYDLLNHPNLINFTGVQTSPFFGRATAASAPRRFEVGTQFSF